MEYVAAQSVETTEEGDHLLIWRLGEVGLKSIIKHFIIVANEEMYVDYVCICNLPGFSSDERKLQPFHGHCCGASFFSTETIKRREEYRSFASLPEGEEDEVDNFSLYIVQ